MAFRMNDIVQRTNAGDLRGFQREIACECWFTSQGKSIPKMIKIMDNSGQIHTIHNVRVITSEEKNYAGIPRIEHICQIKLEQRLEIVKLIFTKENCKWTLIEI